MLLLLLLLLLLTFKTQQRRSSIVSFCDRSTKQLFCICLVVYCFKVLVIIIAIVRLANQRAASISYWSILKTLFRAQNNIAVYCDALSRLQGFSKFLMRK